MPVRVESLVLSRIVTGNRHFSLHFIEERTMFHDTTMRALGTMCPAKIGDVIQPAGRTRQVLSFLT